MVKGFWRNLSLVVGWVVLITIFLPSLMGTALIKGIYGLQGDYVGFGIFIAPLLSFALGAFFLWIAFRKNK